MSHVLIPKFVAGSDGTVYRYGLCECGTLIAMMPVHNPQNCEILETQHRDHVAKVLGYQCDKTPFFPLDVMKDVVARAEQNQRILLAMELQRDIEKVYQSFHPTPKPGKENTP
jgi:hypothetical protein